MSYLCGRIEEIMYTKLEKKIVLSYVGEEIYKENKSFFEDYDLMRNKIIPCVRIFRKAQLFSKEVKAINIHENTSIRSGDFQKFRSEIAYFAPRLVMDDGNWVYVTITETKEDAYIPPARVGIDSYDNLPNVHVEEYDNGDVCFFIMKDTEEKDTTILTDEYGRDIKGTRIDELGRICYRISERKRKYYLCNCSDYGFSGIEIFLIFLRYFCVSTYDMLSKYPEADRFPIINKAIKDQSDVVNRLRDTYKKSEDKLTPLQERIDHIQSYINKQEENLCADNSEKLTMARNSLQSRINAANEMRNSLDSIREKMEYEEDVLNVMKEHKCTRYDAVQMINNNK